MLTVHTIQLTRGGRYNDADGEGFLSGSLLQQAITPSLVPESVLSHSVPGDLFKAGVADRVLL